MHDSGGLMPQFTVDLSERLLREVEETAREFHQSPSEIVERALERFVKSLGEVRAVSASRPADAPNQADWGAVKHTLREAACPYQDCPFAGDCPVEVCPL
jgi:hypothetical protein